MAELFWVGSHGQFFHLKKEESIINANYINQDSGDYYSLNWSLNATLTSTMVVCWLKGSLVKINVCGIVRHHSISWYLIVE